MNIKCYTTGCGTGAAEDVQLVYLHDDGTESDPVWEPMCIAHARLVGAGQRPVLSLMRSVRVTGSRPISEHEHDYRIKSTAPIRIGSAITGHSDIAACPCGDRRAA